MLRAEFVSLFLVALASGCMSQAGDVLVKADGEVVEGKLQYIDGGLAVFDSGSAEVPASGVVWLLDGRALAGTVKVSEGTVTAGNGSAPVDSVYRIVWGGSPLRGTTLSVDASMGWTDTGLELDTGEILSLKAGGTVVTETGVSTPAGQKKYSSSVALVPGATSGQLVFRVGSDGEALPAGELWVGESPGSGVLMVAVNTPLSGSSDSHGVYAVETLAGSDCTPPGVVVFYPAKKR